MMLMAVKMADPPEEVSVNSGSPTSTDAAAESIYRDI